MKFLATTFACLLASGCGSSGSGTGGTQSMPIATTTALQVAPAPVAPGVPVVMTATVSAPSGTPTGQVIFWDGTTQLSVSQLSSGIATYTATSFAAGSSHTIYAVYAGTTVFLQSSSSNVTLLVAMAAPPGTVNAHATFSFATPNQQISGFGAAQAYYFSYRENSPYRSEIDNALFDPLNGLGLTFLRVADYYYNGTNASNFDTSMPQLLGEATTVHGSPFTIFMTDWGLPAALTSNNANKGGTLRQVNGAYDYASFAQYWYDSLAAYSSLGVVPTYVSVQNEPDGGGSIHFNPTEATYKTTNSAGFLQAFNAVYAKLQSMKTPPQIVGPETEGLGNAIDYAAPLPANQIGAIVFHIYGTSLTNPDASLPNMQTMSAAHPNNLKFQTEYTASTPLDVVWDIHNMLTADNANAYFTWSLFWTDTGAVNLQSSDHSSLLILDNPSAPQTSWLFPHGWGYDDSYFALKHFSYYVRPGYTRYNANVDNTDERVSVYQSADQSTTVIVAMNVSPTTTDGLALDLSGITYSSSTILRSNFSVLPGSGGERWASVGPYTTSGIALPPQSVVTIVLKK